IWVDGAVARRAEAGFELEFEEKMAFKGFREKQSVYVLFDHKDFEEERGEEGVMVGRDRELADLLAWGAGLENGRSIGITVVRGEAGIGKSRLVNAFIADLVEQSDEPPQIFLCQADQIVRQSLNPFRYFLRRYFEQATTQSERRNKRNFSRKLDRLIDDIDDSDLQQVLNSTRSFLGALVDLYWPDSLYAQVDPQRRFDNSLKALTAFFQAESARQPILIQLEDVHWLDEDSQKVIVHFMTALVDCPVGMITTARPEHPEPLFGVEIDYELIDLGVLSWTGVQALAELLLAGDVADELVTFLVERIDGNPFFGQQILFYLREQELLVEGADGWQLQSEQKGEAALPTDVRTLLMARLDRLAPKTREVVQTAAVLGREFVLPVLLYMLAGDGAALDEVETAAAANIWGAQSAVRCTFTHALLRDAAYDMQLRARRQALHLRAAEAIEHIFETELAVHYGDLAFHYGQAGRVEAEFKYAYLAGEQAAGQFATREALAYFERGVGLLSLFEASSEAIVDLYNLRGQVLQHLGEFEAVLAGYEALGEWGKKRDDERIRLASLVGKAQIFNMANRLYDDVVGRQVAQEALLLAQSLGDEAAEARVLWILSNLFMFREETELALDYGEKALNLARTHGLKEQMAFVLNDLGHAYGTAGDYERTKQSIQEASVLWRELGNVPMLADSLASLGWYGFFTGDYEKAVRYGDESYRLSESIGNSWGQAYSRATIGNIYWEWGDVGQAMAVMRLSIRLSEEVGFVVPQIFARANLGTLHAQVGALAEGVLLGERALHLARTQLPLWEPHAVGILAQLYMRQGEMDKAEQLLADLEQKPGNVTTVHFQHSLSYLFLAWLKEDVAAGLDLVGEMWERAEALQLRAHWPRIMFWRGRFLALRGAWAEADGVIEKGIGYAEAVGSRWMLWRLWSLRGEVAQGAGAQGKARRFWEVAEPIMLAVEETIPENDWREKWGQQPLVKQVKRKNN
ncbi:MAG TPA: AAA family ATPase, partial [Anaerolineae bacterium]|nr:AAA family ATPase [Anaerolineae bacterium]